MASYNYLPRADSPLYDWAKIFLAYLATHHARWNLMEPPEHLSALLAKFETCLLKCLDPNHGSVDVAEKNDVKQQLIKALRDYVQGHIARNIAVTVADRKAMNLPV